MHVHIRNRLIVVFPFFVFLIFILLARPIHAAATQAPLTDPQIAEALKAADAVRFSFAKKALKKGDSKDIKDFAEYTLTEQNEENLTKVQLMKGVPGPASMRIKKQERAMSRQLNKAKGQKFDRLYVEQQMKFHESLLKDIDKTWIPAAQDPELKKALQSTRAQVKTYVDDTLDAYISIRK